MDHDLSVSSFENGDIGAWRYVYTPDTPSISEAVLANNKRALKRILKKPLKKPLPLRADAVQGWTAVHIAASRRKYMDCLEILLLRGKGGFINVDGTTSEGRTALHIACANNCIPAVRCLLKNGAKTDICDDYKRLALHYALLNGRTEIFQILLQSSDVSRIEKYCSLKTKIELRENHVYWSLTCCAISSGNLECFAALMDSKLPQSILQSPTLVARADIVRVFSPLTFLLYSYNKKPEKLDSFLPLLLKYEVIMPSMFHGVLRSGLLIHPFNSAGLTVYENPFSAIFSNSLTPAQQEHYFNLLIANNVTADYCLQCYGDTSRPFPPPSKADDTYLLYYKSVLDAVKSGNVNAVRLLLANSAILELDPLIIHSYFCSFLFDECEFLKNMLEFLSGLKLQRPKFYDGPPVEESRCASLKQLCRVTIREQLRGTTLGDNLRDFRRKISELPLPSILKDYLLFKN